METFTEPKMKCPNCGLETSAEWVDIGFGPYSQQAGPFHCYSCGWTEKGCSANECCKSKCVSWEYCKGDAIN